MRLGDSLLRYHGVAITLASLAALSMGGCASTGSGETAIRAPFGGSADAAAYEPAYRTQRDPVRGDHGLIPVPWPRETATFQRPVVHMASASQRRDDAPTVQRPAHDAPGTSGGPKRLIIPAVNAPVVTVEPRGTGAAVAPPAPAPALLVPPKVELKPVEPKVAAVEAPQPVLSPAESLVRARGLMKDGQLAAARKVLSAPALADDPAGIAALAETYDPLVLGTSPKLHGAADAGKATELYLLAVSKGNMDALKRLSALQALHKK